jgi:hypothetical protein
MAIWKELAVRQEAAAGKSALRRKKGELFPVYSEGFYASLTSALVAAKEGDELIEVRYAFRDGYLSDFAAYESLGLRRLEQLEVSVQRFALGAAPAERAEPLKLLRPEDRA